MTGHGLTVRGDSIKNVVYRAYYTKEAARIQSQSLPLASVTTIHHRLLDQEATDASKMNESEWM
jgi:ribulose-5-phosphate 4-epimerase/fuculose-1-phosphate aldolase